MPAARAAYQIYGLTHGLTYGLTHALAYARQLAARVTLFACSFDLPVSLLACCMPRPPMLNRRRLRLLWHGAD